MNSFLCGGFPFCLSHRGTVSGFFSLCGSLGILVTSKISGVLYQSWRPTGTNRIDWLFRSVDL